VTVSFGRPHRHLRRTDSTNARARELALAGAPSGLVVTAEEQTAGRGRRGRPWFAPPGSALLYSALLRPWGERPLLPIAVPLAVCDTAEALASVRCRVKWPNDVWVEERKLAGVLIEGRSEAGDGWAVIGVGLNVAVPPERLPAELRGSAASLGEAVAVSDALAELNRRLGRWVEAEEAAILAAFRERDALRGRRLRWQGGSGVAAGIDEAGHLLVDADDGARVVLGAGEVHLAVEGRAP
jgi:BirA family transcriptional regulator, biotin operon repressor / biotin---[acetyl-CoA-carboxylase] ligase